MYIEDESVLLVRQYRYAYGESLYELPAGKLEKGEDPSLTALRELEEETGIKATKTKLIAINYPTPGYTNEKIYIYRAFDGKRTQTNFDDGEYLDAEFIPLVRAKEMLKTGEIKDGKTVIALQAYFLGETE